MAEQLGLNWTVLVIDDNVGDRRLLQAVLQDAASFTGTVLTASSLAEGYDFLKREQVDIVLVDVEMSDATGTESVASVRRMNDSVAIVVMSGSMNQELGRQALRIGAQEYLQKSDITGEHLVGCFQRALERAGVETEMVRLAHHDALTGLHNRYLFDHSLEHALSQAGRSKRLLGLLMIDLDGFKSVNDTFGHAAGDEVLKAVAKVLQGSVRESDIVARLGGDEFSVLLENLSEPADAVRIAEAMVEAVREGMQDLRGGARVTASIGVALFENKNGPALAASELRHRADAALYEAKRKGKSRVCLHTENVTQEQSRAIAFVTELRHAALNGEFVHFLQPVLDCDGELVGAELLLRWARNDLGVLAPPAFLRKLSSLRLQWPVVVGALRGVLTRFQRWHDEGFKPIDIALNLGPKDLANKGFIDELIGLLHDFPLQLPLFGVEVAERTLADMSTHSAEQLASLCDLNIRLTVDHFGAAGGYLEHLRGLPVQEVKLAPGLVRSIDTDMFAKAQFDALAGLAADLGYALAVCGIEDEATYDLARRFAPCRLQGEYLFPPMGFEQFAVRCASLTLPGKGRTCSG